MTDNEFKFMNQKRKLSFVENINATISLCRSLHNINGKRSYVYAASDTREESYECCKSAVKISSRSKLRRSQTATHVARETEESTEVRKVYSRITLNARCDAKSLRFLIYERYKKRFPSVVFL